MLPIRTMIVYSKWKTLAVNEDAVLSLLGGPKAVFFPLQLKVASTKLHFLSDRIVFLSLDHKVKPRTLFFNCKLSKSWYMVRLFRSICATKGGSISLFTQFDTCSVTHEVPKSR